jgi:hypothetical protein
MISSGFAVSANLSKTMVKKCAPAGNLRSPRGKNRAKYRAVLSKKRGYLAALSAEVESAPPVSGIALRHRRVAEIQNAAHKLLGHQPLSRPGGEGGVPKQNNKKYFLKKIFCWGIF